MTPPAADLDALEAIAKAATKGPWKRMSGASWNVLDEGGSRIVWARSEDSENGTPRDLANAAHIVAFNPEAALQLIAELKRLRARVQDIDALIVRCADVAFDAIMDGKGPISTKDAILSIATKEQP